jgi:hypothetical protein
MNKEIIFSRNQYELKYNDLLESYLSNGYEDLEQIDFINSEILIYGNYIKKISFLRIRAHNSGRIDWQGWENNLDEIETQLKNKLYSIDNDFNEQIFINVNTSFEKIIKFLELQKLNPTPKTNPKHENIFCNNGFELFEYILNEYVKSNRGRLSDIHFFYWSMHNNEPQLIHQRPERFKEWFNEKYNEDLGKIKTYTQVENPDRKIHYSNALDWFKLQNK